MSAPLPHFPQPSRRPTCLSEHRRSALFIIVALLAAIGPCRVGSAQTWDPFSQLETNRSERRSKAPRSESAPTADRSGNADGPQNSETSPPSGAYQRPAPANSTIRSEPLAPLAGTTDPAPTPAAPQSAVPALPPSGGQQAKTSPSSPAPSSPPQQQGIAPGKATPNPVTISSGKWQGLDVPNIERLIAALTLPPRSRALHDLWRRLVATDEQAAAAPDPQIEALRLEALYRSGLLSEINTTLARQPADAASPLVAMLKARSEIGLGRRDAGCSIAKSIKDIRGDIPKPLRSDAILVSGYCAAATGDTAVAGLLAELAREEGLPPSPGLAALDAVASGVKSDVSLKKGQRLSLIDYRILELANAAPPPAELIAVAAPALLVALATDAATADDLRLDAAEAATRINALDADALAGVYRTFTRKQASNTPVESAPEGKETARRRALLFAAAESERTPFKKVRQIRSFLDSARRSDLYGPALAMSAKLTSDIGLVPEIGWFAETAIETNLAAADYQRARMWAKFAASADSARGTTMGHWLALSDIADPNYPDPRGASLADLERVALMGRFSAENLHRLATVLDALEYNVPIPLWEAASRTPQPSAGHLPQTGVLSDLQDASKKREFARTVLLAMQALGPTGAEGAHMISLGDSIRALKRAGLESDARRLGLEALLSGWPRMVTQ